MEVLRPLCNVNFLWTVAFLITVLKKERDRDIVSFNLPQCASVESLSQISREFVLKFLSDTRVSRVE